MDFLPGLYHMPGQWGNLPEGETCTTPANVEGIFQAELLGDYFTEKYGLQPGTHQSSGQPALGWEVSRGSLSL
jgi:hypothetical protein